MTIDAPHAAPDGRGAAAAPAVLVTGASGFVGHALWPALEAAGYRVRRATRDVARARARWPERTWAAVDVESGSGLAPALQGCRAAYYLVHGMSGATADFRAREVAAAHRFAAAAAAAGVWRIDYLGGIAAAGPPSEHLRSRLEVEEVLRGGGVPARRHRSEAAQATAEAEGRAMTEAQAIAYALAAA